MNSSGSGLRGGPVETISPSLPLVYRGFGFGTMVRRQACKAAVGVCVGSNPLADS